jgi:hypothetical protein
VITTVQEWVALLQRADSLIGLPLILIGLALALGGWRLWKICVVVTFAAIGAVVGVLLADTPSDQLFYAIIGAVMLGAVSFPPAQYSITVIGGLISTGITYLVCDTIPLFGWPLWISLGLCFAASVALCYLYLRQVIVIITSFEGAVLIVSGVAAFLSDWPDVFNFFGSIANNYWFFLPFLLLVPTVMGTMLQYSDVKEKEAGMSQG